MQIRTLNLPQLGFVCAAAAMLSMANAVELKLVTTELTLVDGRTVPGQLACEMKDRLILYSPNLGTLASFEKRFVAEYVVLKDKKKIMLNPARPLNYLLNYYETISFA